MGSPDSGEPCFGGTALTSGPPCIPRWLEPPDALPAAPSPVLFSPPVGVGETVATLTGRVRRRRGRRTCRPPIARDRPFHRPLAPPTRSPPRSRDRPRSPSRPTTR